MWFMLMLQCCLAGWPASPWPLDKCGACPQSRAAPASSAPSKILEIFALNGNYSGKVPLYLVLNVSLPKAENDFVESLSCLKKKKKAWVKSIAASEMEYVYFYGPLWNELAVTNNYFTHPLASFWDLPGFKIPNHSEAKERPSWSPFFQGAAPCLCQEKNIF